MIFGDSGRWPSFELQGRGQGSQFDCLYEFGNAIAGVKSMPRSRAVGMGSTGAAALHDLNIHNGVNFR